MTKLYLCNYQYEGKKYSFHIPASSKKDAAARLKAVAQGTVDGELVFSSAGVKSDSARSDARGNA